MENLERDPEWKEEVTQRVPTRISANDRIIFVIQEIDADMTSPAFVMNEPGGAGRFLYTSSNELDQFDVSCGSSSASCALALTHSNSLVNSAWAFKV